MLHTSRVHAVAFPLLAAGLLGLCGCNSTTLFPDRCNVLVVAVSPPAPSLAVGDSLTLTAAYTGAVECQPDVPASELHWSSADTTVASVDSLLGVVRARQVGAAEITVHAPGKSAVLGGATVSVTGP
jgi:uncharacterized protein YjdB